MPKAGTRRGRGRRTASSWRSWTSKQRGAGEFFGTKQAGLPEFRVANLLRDRELLELAKVEAGRLAPEPDPAVSREERDAVWARLKQQWQRRYGLVQA